MKVPLVGDQSALSRIYCNDVPCLLIAVAEADLALCARYRAVSIPALSIATNSHFARVKGFTAW